MARIREEEIFRQEVRRALEKQPANRSFLGRVYAFFNTGLGLFLLSTVAVGGITQLFTWSQERIAAAERREQLARELDAEIGARVSTLAAEANLHMDRLRELPAEDVLQSRAAREFVGRLAHDISETPKRAPSLIETAYPKFEDLSLLSLLQQRSDVEVGGQETAKERLETLQVLYERARYFDDRGLNRFVESPEGQEAEEPEAPRSNSNGHGQLGYKIFDSEQELEDFVRLVRSTLQELGL